MIKKCWNINKKTKLGDLFTIILFVIICSFCLWLIWGLILTKPADEKFFVGGWMLIFPIVSPVYLGYIELSDIKQRYSRYRMDDTGITMFYMWNKEKHYMWDEVDEISVCDVYHSNSFSGIYTLVIRIVIGEEPNGPRNPKCKKNMFGYEKWRKNIYTYRHMNNIILLEYSEEKYLEIKNISGKEIKDYRKVYSARQIKLP